MAISWGAETGHMQVGIDVRTDSYDTNTPSINVYVDLYVRTVGWGANDAQTLTATGSISGSWNYTMSSGTGQTTQLLVATVTIPGQGQNYNGGPSYTFGGQVSGSALGGQPSHAISWSLPPKPPNVPTQPGTGHDSITSSSARIIVTAADGRGAAIDVYEAYVLTNNAWPFAGGNVVASWQGGTGTATGLSRATTYYYTARAHNSVGWSGWTAMGVFATSATVPDAPSTPTVGTITPTGANVSFSAPNNGGSAITGYDIQVATNSAFTENVQTGAHSGSPIVLGSLSPGTVYYARVRGKNAIGAGAWSPSVSFQTLASVFVKVGGTWTQGVLYVKVNGLWTIGAVHAKVGGAWRSS